MRKPKIVLAVVVVLAVSLASSVALLNSGGRSRTYRLEVAGAEGREVMGVVTIDGAAQRLSVKLPKQFEYQGKAIDFAFAPADAGQESIGVHVFVDGVQWGWASAPGVKGHVSHRGTIGSGGGLIAGMAESELVAIRE